MADDSDGYDDENGFAGGGDAPAGGTVDEDPPTYHSGRVRIIGAEPAGDFVRDPSGPVLEEHPELPHWNEPPTGQVPAVLDRSTGEEQAVAPPTWREEETDWEAHEEVFEPAMLSEDLPAVGALIGEMDEVDVERQPWHFTTDDTLVIAPEPGLEPSPEPEPEPCAGPDPVSVSRPPVGPVVGRVAPALVRPGSPKMSGIMAVLTVSIPPDTAVPGAVAVVVASCTSSRPRTGAPTSLASVSSIMGKNRDSTRSLISPFGAERTKTPSSNATGSSTDNQSCQVVSDTWSRRDPLHFVHRSPA